MKFHCGFIDPLFVGLVLHAKVFLAIFFLLQMMVDVLSPNVICSLYGVILPGTRLGLSSGAFSESDVSGDSAHGIALCVDSSSL